MEMREAIQNALRDLTETNETKKIANVVVIYQYEDKHSRTLAINDNLGSAISLLGHIEVAAGQLRHMILQSEHELAKQSAAKSPEKPVVQISRDIVH